MAFDFSLLVRRWVCLSDVSCVSGLSKGNSRKQHITRPHQEDAKTFKKKVSKTFWMRQVVFSGADDRSSYGVRDLASFSTLLKGCTVAVDSNHEIQYSIGKQIYLNEKMQI